MPPEAIALSAGPSGEPENKRAGRNSNLKNGRGKQGGGCIAGLH